MFQTASHEYVSLNLQVLENLLAEDNGEIRILHKINPETHLYCKKSSRQRVRTAAQLLSQSTARALTFVFGEKMATQADAIQTINDWFDVMNSRRMYDKKPLSCAFGVHLKEQVQALENMEYLIRRLCCHSRRAYYTDVNKSHYRTL